MAYEITHLISTKHFFVHNAKRLLLQLICFMSFHIRSKCQIIDALLNLLVIKKRRCYVFDLHV